MIHIDWKWSSQDGSWGGSVSSSQRHGDVDGMSIDYGSNVTILIFPKHGHFDLYVHIAGTLRHRSEYECLCEAKKDALQFLKGSPSFEAERRAVLEQGS